MKLGVMLEGQDGLTWDLWRRIMARVEELGFESLWCSDHFMSIVDSNRDVPRDVGGVDPYRRGNDTAALRIAGVSDDLSASIPSGAHGRSRGHPERWTAGLGGGRWLERTRASRLRHPLPTAAGTDAHARGRHRSHHAAARVTSRPISPAAIISSTVPIPTPNPPSVPASHCSSAPRVWGACSGSWRAMPMSGTRQASPHPPLTAPGASAWRHTAVRSTAIPATSAAASQRPTSSAAMQRNCAAVGKPCNSSSRAWQHTTLVPCQMSSGRRVGWSARQTRLSCSSRRWRMKE